MAQQQNPSKDRLTQKFNLNEDVPARESLMGDDSAQSWSAAADASGSSMNTASTDMDASETTQNSQQGTGDAIQALRTSAMGVLDSVVREYEPQINEFATNLAHQAIDRGVDFAETAVQRVRQQSWLRLGVAAALGLGIVAVLGYEAEKAIAAQPKSRKPLH